MSELTVNQVDVAKLKVEPGEILMVTCEGPITAEQGARVKDAFYRAFQQSDGNVPTILVIDDRITATVVRVGDVIGLDLSKAGPSR